jgi:hypothetical protein
MGGVGWWSHKILYPCFFFISIPNSLTLSIKSYQITAKNNRAIRKVEFHLLFRLHFAKTEGESSLRGAAHEKLKVKLLEGWPEEHFSVSPRVLILSTPTQFNFRNW